LHNTALVVEPADTTDSKSVALKACGFDSHREHIELPVKSNKSKNYFKKLLRNVQMSSDGGAAGMRTHTNPKKSGRVRIGNQSTRRHEITITEDDLRELWEKQNGLCHWLGIKMSLEDLFVTRSPFAPSVDRIDNTRGYHKDNIVLCTRFANLGRGAYHPDDFSTRMILLLKEVDFNNFK
jgi:hypothetical protein